MPLYHYSPGRLAALLAKMEAPPKAFVMFLPIDTPGDCLDKLDAWGTKRYVRFKVSRQAEQRDLVVAGGFFDPLRAPKSFQGFRSLMITNLKNWGIKRPHYERGWIQYVTPKAWQLELTTPEERRAEAQALVARATSKALRHLRTQTAEREARVARGSQALQSLVNRRVKIGFNCLAQDVQQRRVALAGARARKKRAFNEQRFGLLDLGVTYADEETDTCNSWQEVKHRRRDFPQPAWKNREDERMAQTARERQESERAVELFRAQCA